ncbi:H-NS family nucleoid-associated regulatory protein [Cupriavidus basilensis]|uniref:H-NS family nucleoid-associated regulatory protein n=1 Tax=Cupriavidus basilensis TaxID=68895 RepID=UPI00284CB498|nr:H-NS family nucleoid-associated regulatory protein [Cupriavidus basilensis]MDR3382282.1 H-NS family nucleoid-associated regulatory protein [Cupriavidus basilensis]
MPQVQPGDLLRIPARQLIISPRNRRRRPRRMINEMAASLLAHGQIKNLSVIEHVSRKKNAPTHEVVDGGGRLLAALQNIEAGKLPEDFEFLCKMEDAGQAEEISIAANMHEAMHPADEFDAFRDMINAGSTTEEVAARFGVTPLVVRRRLKLASVSPNLVQSYRDDEMSLDQLMALAITDDQAAQERVWKRVKDLGPWEQTPAKLRAALAMPGAINAKTDRLARFVGLNAYEAAGGSVMRDLFSDGGGFIGDGELLARLAEEKLEATAERIRAEGWSWVEALGKVSYSDMESFGKSQAKKRALTDEEQAQLTELQARAAEIDQRNAALDVEDDELLEELGSVEEQIEALEASIATYTDRQKAKAGAIITITHNGELEIHRGLIKPTKGKAKGKNLRSNADGGEFQDADQDGVPEESAERPISESLMAKLTAHRTGALQALVAGSPAVALVLVLHAMVTQVFTRLDHRLQLARIQASNQRSTIQRAADDLEASRAWQSMEASIASWEDRLPGEGEDLFTWLQALSQADQLDLLAVCVAHTIDTQATREDSAVHEHANQLAAAVDLDMADWWQPTAGSYLASVPKSRRMEAVREAVSEEAAASIGTMKKDAMIGAAEQYLEGRRWLPAVLRRPAVDAEPAAETEASSAKSTKPPIRYRDANGNTWTGRGKQPGWLAHALAAGQSIDAFLVQ